MQPTSVNIKHLISVIIPCYNHAHYLAKAIDSVLNQSYKHVEVVVIDDGSKDNTGEVAQSYGDKVRYIYKDNAGLSAARNTGILHARGEYIVFLDADDWLYPKALETNLHYLLENKEAAFVSGGHDKIFMDKNFEFSVTDVYEKSHYQYLLSNGNYIGVPAAVMYQRWVLEEIRFDESLKACEDYDLYLRIARNYPVLHHIQKVAAYRIHSSSMSNNPVFMLNAALKVLYRQKEFLQNTEEELAYKKGKRYWERYYSLDLYKKIVNGNYKASKDNLMFIFNKQPIYIFKYAFRLFAKPFTRKIKKPLFKKRN